MLLDRKVYVLMVFSSMSRSIGIIFRCIQWFIWEGFLRHHTIVLEGSDLVEPYNVASLASYCFENEREKTTNINYIAMNNVEAGGSRGELCCAKHG